MSDAEFIAWLMADNLLREMPLATSHWRPPSWVLSGDGKGPRLLVGTSLRDPVMDREMIIKVWLQ